MGNLNIKDHIKAGYGIQILDGKIKDIGPAYKSNKLSRSDYNCLYASTSRMASIRDKIRMDSEKS